MRIVFIGAESNRGWLEAGLPDNFELSIAAADDPDLGDVLAECDFYVGWGPLDADMVSAAENLRFVQVIGTGTDWIDLTALREAEIPVANTVGANAAAVGELVVALVLALNRHIPEAHARVKTGSWPQTDLVQRGTYELSGKTVGLIGFGAAGQATARVMRGFEVDVLFYDPVTPSPEVSSSLNATPVAIDDVLEKSDIVSLHVPLNSKTEGLINKEALAMMKQDALLINASRGPVVDEFALAEALENGRLRGAGIDVYSVEPVAPDNPLLQAPNVIFTPHFGGMTQESFRRHMEIARDNIRRILANKPPLHAVPYPED